MFRTLRRSCGAALVMAALVIAPSVPALGGDAYHYVTGLDPKGDNFLALRTDPSTRAGRRIAKLGPDTRLYHTGETSGPWLEVLVVSGPHRDETGWVHGNWVACCAPLE